MRSDNSNKLVLWGGIAVIALLLVVTTVFAVTTLLDDEDSNDSNASANNESQESSDSSDDAASAEECIITVYDEKYDVQPLRDTHTGGDVFECGTDMTATFEGQHGMDLDRIAQYKVEADGGDSSDAGLPMFTLARVSENNTADSCYVAYKGMVYDVTGLEAWEDCSHRGVDGGQDITDIPSPHTDDIFDMAEKIGTLEN
jgi:predicted heme/steroid binding protein